MNGMEQIREMERQDKEGKAPTTLDLKPTTKVIMYDPKDPQQLVALVQDLEKKLETAMVANKYLSRPGSSCPKASDIDCQLASMYMNFFAGVYAELTEANSNVQGIQERMYSAHAFAMEQVKQFRKEILNGQGPEDHYGSTERDLDQD